MKVLGIVEWASVDRNGSPIARVRPVYEVQEDEWRPIEASEFPEEGLLFWHHAPEAQKDALIICRAVDNKNAKDAFRVSDPQPAIEVLDLRRHGTADNVRLAIARGGASFKVACARALLWCKDDVFVGPVRVIPVPGGFGLEKATLHRLACYRLEADSVINLSGRDAGRRVLDVTTLGTPFTFVDWDDDRTVVRRAIEFVIKRSRDEQVTLERQITKQLMLAVSEAIAEGEGGSELPLERYRLERACSLVPRAEQIHGLADELLERVARLPQVEEAIGSLLEEEREKARARADAELAGAQGRLEAARQECKETDAKLQRVKRELQDAQAELQRKEALIATPIPSPGNGPRNDATQVRLVAPMEPTELLVKPWKMGRQMVSDKKDLRQRLMASLKANGTAPSVLWQLHAAFAAQLMPLLAGPRALDTLEAYAQVVAGGRHTVIQVSAAMLEAADLFGKVDVAYGRFVPQSAGLLDLFEAARESEGFHLLVIAGANRGPTESYLLPLLRLMQRGGAQPLFHPAAVTAADPYRRHHSVRWPSNVLLAGTLVEGPTTLPVAPDLWHSAVLLRPEAFDLSDEGTSVSCEVSDLAPGSSLMSVASDARAAHETIGELVSDMRELKDLAPSLARYFAALGSLLPTPERCREFTVSGMLAPYVASLPDGDMRQEMVSVLEAQLTTTSDDLREAIAIASRSVS